MEYGTVAICYRDKCPCWRFQPFLENTIFENGVTSRQPTSLRSWITNHKCWLSMTCSLNNTCCSERKENTSRQSTSLRIWTENPKFWLMTYLFRSNIQISQNCFFSKQPISLRICITNHKVWLSMHCPFKIQISKNGFTSILRISLLIWMTNHKFRWIRHFERLNPY